MTRISPDNFILEVKRFGISKDSQVRVRMMQRGNLIFLKFNSPMSGEEIETSISLESFMRMEFLNWGSIAVPAIWESEDDLLLKINKTLEENASTITHNRRDSQRIGQSATQ